MKKETPLLWYRACEVRPYLNQLLLWSFPNGELKLVFFDEHSEFVELADLFPPTDLSIYVNPANIMESCWTYTCLNEELITDIITDWLQILEDTFDNPIFTNKIGVVETLTNCVLHRLYHVIQLREQINKRLDLSEHFTFFIESNKEIH